MKFSHLYEELKFDDVFPVASPDDVKQRKEQYTEIRIKEIFNDVKKTKLPDGTWHVHETLFVNECNLESLKELNVSIVDGSFSCADNRLTSLEGCPKKINGFFNCSHNKLTSLEGCPQEANGFYCFNNELSNLKGCPKYIDGTFSCSNNKITSLIDGPESVKMNFFCDHNRLTSLDGCPEHIRGEFDCSHNLVEFDEDTVKKQCSVDGDIKV